MQEQGDFLHERPWSEDGGHHLPECQGLQRQGIDAEAGRVGPHKRFFVCEPASTCRGKPQAVTSGMLQPSKMPVIREESGEASEFDGDNCSGVDSDSEAFGEFQGGPELERECSQQDDSSAWVSVDLDADTSCSENFECEERLADTPENALAAHRVSAERLELEGKLHSAEFAVGLGISPEWREVCLTSAASPQPKLHGLGLEQTPCLTEVADFCGGLEISPGGSSTTCAESPDERADFGGSTSSSPQHSPEDSFDCYVVFNDSADGEASKLPNGELFKACSGSQWPKADLVVDARKCGLDVDQGGPLPWSAGMKVKFGQDGFLDLAPLHGATGAAITAEYITAEYVDFEADDSEPSLRVCRGGA